METLAFTLELIDKVSGNAHKAAESVRKVQAQSKKAQKAIDFSAEIKRTQSQLDKLKVDPKGFQQMLKLQKAVREEREKLKNAMTPRAGFWSSFTEKLPFRTVAQYTQAAFTGGLMAEGVMKAAGFLIDAGKQLVSIITDGFKSAINESSKQQVLKLGERISLGAGGGKDFAEDIGRFSGITGFDDDVIRGMLLPLRRAGFDQQASRSAFAGAADIAAGLGKGGDEGTVAGILETFQHIKLKGGIAEKQLVGLGVSPKAIYEDIAKQLKISTEAADKKVSEGKIDDPQRIINAILSGVEKQQGGMLGTGAIAYSNTFEAKWRKITELPSNFFKKLENTSAWTRLTEAADRFLQKLDPDGESGARIFKRLEDMFGKLVGWIEKMTSEEGLDQLVAAFETALDVVKGIVSFFDTLIGLMSKAAGFAAKFTAPLLPLRGSKDDGLNPDNAGAFGSYLGMLEGLGISTPATAMKGGGKSVSASSVVHVHVNGNAGANPEETGRRVGKAAAPHVDRSIERAAQEGGG